MTRKWIGPLLKIFGTNWITLFGTSLTTISALAIVAFLFLGILGLVDSPYIALMALLVLPGVFVFGLLLIPGGLYLERRRIKKEGGLPDESASRPFPIIDLNSEKIRRVSLGVGVLTVLNVMLISIVSYEGVLYMDSSEFCGEVCHSVMAPEFTAYSNSPHSRVECVECHIGPGAPWFVRSKLSGMGQVLAVTFDHFQRPIPTPVENLRPSQDTCEQCHWPDRFSGDRIKVITHYSEDETNTPLKTVLLLHIGGASGESGIHSWHIDPSKETSYIASDPQRQQIAWVQVKEDGKTTEFTLGGKEIEMTPAAQQEVRRMDCIDCHNRPTHVFSLPGPAMDKAMAAGRIDSSIPFIKKTGTEVLTRVGEAGGQAEQVVQDVRSFYLENYSDFYNSERHKVEEAVREIEAIYKRNVFPNMKLTWGTYPSNIGHENFPGCFRCHDGDHTSSDGVSIEQDCDTCHSILAWDEESPEILDQLGLK